MPNYQKQRITGLIHICTYSLEFVSHVASWVVLYNRIELVHLVSVASGNGQA